MSVIRKKPYVEALLATMSDANLKDLHVVLNSGGDNVNLDFAHLDAATYKNKVTPVYFQLEDCNLKTGILIWTNSMCALICYHRFQDLVIYELSPAYHTFKKINEYCDINELRRVLDDTLETKGTIESGDAEEGTLPFADGEGGATWDKPVDYIKGDDFPDAESTAKMVAIDGNGNLVKADLPEGTFVVDSALSDNSENPVQNKVINAALTEIEGDVSDIETALETKANVDGNYPTMTVGAADNLTPYDESAGDDQDDPFSFQATGTGNGSQADFATGALALMKEKRGNSVVVNQLVDSGTTEVTTISGHKYLTIFSGVYAIVTSTGVAITVNDDTTDKVIDLTQWFNANIPADLLAHPENWYRYYQGSLAYNAGQIVNANSRYIKCIGRNQWDEEWEVGSINVSTGINETNNNAIRSKKYIKVISGSNIRIQSAYTGSGQVPYIYFYDINKNYIGYDNAASDQNSKTFAIPNNCCYIRFTFPNLSTPVTYNNNITVSIYYSGESGYNEYYPYEVLTNNDTGTEELLAFDYKTPDGVIHHKTLPEIDLGDITWEYNGDHVFRSAVINTLKNITDSEIGKLICSKYTKDAVVNLGDKCIGTTNQRLYIKDTGTGTDATAFKAAMDGVKLQAEAAEPTTEQGTPFSENLIIDDFGSMEFSGTSGVPQGNLIFYPVDYKAFVDTLYDYTEGTPSELVKQSDLSAVDNKIGAKLPECPTDTDGTYVLKATVSDGTVTYSWVLEE